MKRILFIFLFTIIMFNLVHAQKAMGFFHLGANLYIKGHLDQAIQVVQEGLQKFPQDPYLNALAKKLKQKKQQRQQQQQQQQQKKQGQKKQQAQKEKQKQENKQQQQQQQKGQKKQMTKKEAERILQALKEENKKFKKEHLRVPAGRRQMDKNW